MKTMSIIDEEKNMADDMITLLDKLSLDISVIGSAQSVSEARSLLRTLKPDIVMIAVCPPGLSGLSLIEYAKPFLPNSAYIIVSSSEDYNCIKKALSLGVVDYLNTPLTSENVGAALQKSLSFLDFIHARLQYNEFDQILRLYQSCMNQSGANLALLFNALDRLKARLSFEDYKKQLYKLLCAMTAIALTENVSFHAQTRQLPLSRELSSATSYQQLDGFARNYINQMIGVNKKTTAEGSNDALVKAKLYIEENYHTDISLEKLAEVVHMNPTYLSVIFKRNVGMTYVKYITTLRIEKSKHLLEEGQRIIDVCHAVGYNNYRYFCSVFKKATGQSPSDYRETFKKERKGTN